MNLIIVLVLFMVITFVMPKHGMPPKPRFAGKIESSSMQAEVAKRVALWSPGDNNNAWELSEQFEGDIMLYDNADLKNVLQDDNARWPKAVVPYSIDKMDFSQEDQDVITKAFEEYHLKTCVRFRPYKEGDEDFIKIEGKQSGCWSYVGRHGGGQVVNLQNPGCVHHGIIVHEMLHALGFYHQQSAYERDDFVKINWENIKLGKEHNFRKYSEATVTNFGVQYDYGSIMHYSAYAFSKNGKPTIMPLVLDSVRVPVFPTAQKIHSISEMGYFYCQKNGTTIGQREGLSEKDIKKLGKIYGDFKSDDEGECGEDGDENPDMEEEEEYLMFLPRTKPFNRL